MYFKKIIISFAIGFCFQNIAYAELSMHKNHYEKFYSAQENNINEIDTVKSSATQGHENINCPQFVPFGFPKSYDEKIIRRAFHLCQKAYSSFFDPATKTPLWVAEHLKSDSLDGNAKRMDNFKKNPLIPAAAQPSSSDYSKSNFDQGHMAPAADFKNDQAEMAQSFFFTNIIPQNPDNNRNAWNKLETLIRIYAKERGEIFVMTGPLFLKNNGKTKETVTAPMIPSHIFKIIIDPKSLESFAIILPNDSIDIHFNNNSLSDWQNYFKNYLYPISEVEKYSGFNFNPQIPSAIQNIEGKINWNFSNKHKNKF